MANPHYKTMLALKRLAGNISHGAAPDALQSKLDAILATGHAWGMAHDLASVKALIVTVPGGEMTAGKRRMAAFLVNEELDRLSCINDCDRACVGTPLTEYRSRAFRSGKIRVFVRANGEYYVFRPDHAWFGY